MSIAYNQTDSQVPTFGHSVSFTEYERRAERAKKELDDVIGRVERQHSLSKNSYKPGVAQVAHKEPHAEHEPAPMAEGEETDGEGKQGEKWWTRTDQAFLNDKPDKALEDEATNTQFSHYTYVPQHSLADGAYTPAYLKAKNEVPAM